MKESLFEMLLSLFETTLLRLKEVSDPESGLKPLIEKKITEAVAQEKNHSAIFHLMVVKEPSQQAIRVFTLEEQMKLTKASYQFLMRLKTWGVISSEIMELVLNRLLLSESHIVSLRETKWTIRSLLADKLGADQLAYLDLVLYHTEDVAVRH